MPLRLYQSPSNLVNLIIFGYSFRWRASFSSQSILNIRTKEKHVCTQSPARFEHGQLEWCFSLLFTFFLDFYLINIHIFDYPDSGLPRLFTEVPTSPENQSATVSYRSSIFNSLLHNFNHASNFFLLLFCSAGRVKEA